MFRLDASECAQADGMMPGSHPVIRRCGDSRSRYGSRRRRTRSGGRLAGGVACSRRRLAKSGGHRLVHQAPSEVPVIGCRHNAAAAAVVARAQEEEGPAAIGESLGQQHWDFTVVKTRASVAIAAELCTPAYGLQHARRASQRSGDDFLHSWTSWTIYLIDHDAHVLHCLHGKQSPTQPKF